MIPKTSGVLSVLSGFFRASEKVSVVHLGKGFRREFWRRLSIVNFVANVKTNKLK